MCAMQQGSKNKCLISSFFPCSCNPSDDEGQQMSTTAECPRPLPPMPVVAERGDIGALKARVTVMLIAEGTHVDDKGTGSKSGIMLAAKNSKGDAVDFLISAKADVNGVDVSTGQDVLQHACQGNDPTIVRERNWMIVALITAGCTVSHADKTGRNCLDFAQEAKMKHVGLIPPACNYRLISS
eukprot:756055-Hanusia_phi.AAC.6